MGPLANPIKKRDVVTATAATNVRDAEFLFGRKNIGHQIDDLGVRRA